MFEFATDENGNKTFRSAKAASDAARAAFGAYSATENHWRVQIARVPGGPPAWVAKRFRRVIR